MAWPLKKRTPNKAKQAAKIIPKYLQKGSPKMQKKRTKEEIKKYPKRVQKITPEMSKKRPQKRRRRRRARSRRRRRKRWEGGGDFPNFGAQKHPQAENQKKGQKHKNLENAIFQLFAGYSRSQYKVKKFRFEIALFVAPRCCNLGGRIPALGWGCRWDLFCNVVCEVCSKTILFCYTSGDWGFDFRLSGVSLWGGVLGGCLEVVEVVKVVLTTSTTSNQNIS